MQWRTFKRSRFGSPSCLAIVALLIRAVSAGEGNAFDTPIADTKATTDNMSINPVYVKGKEQLLKWTFDHSANWTLYLYRYDPKKPDARSHAPIMSFNPGYSGSNDTSWTWTVDPEELGFKSPMSTYWLHFYTNSTFDASNDSPRAEFWSHYFNMTDDASRASDSSDNKDQTVVQHWNDLSTPAKAAIGVAGGLAVLLVIAIIASLIIWRRLTKVRYMSEPRSRLPSFDSTRELRASSKDIAAEYHAIAEKQGQGRYYAAEAQNSPRVLRPEGDGPYWRDSPMFY